MICPYHVLTGTGSTYLFLIFICKLGSSFSDYTYRDFQFEIVLSNEVYHRFDTSHEIWENFSARNKSLQKETKTNEIEHIEDPCYVTITVNSKEYLKKFESGNINEKHKGLQKGVKGMHFEYYSKGIKSVEASRPLVSYSLKNKNKIDLL